MLRTLRKRLTYANVMATAAMFVALGGGAYAVSGVPDRSGVFHGCVSNRTGVLRVVKHGGSCAKAHGRGRRHTPGETAISWSERGPRGPQGAAGAAGARGVPGIQGKPGDTGKPGQDATKLFAYVDDFNANTTAAVQYGSGVASVTDPTGATAYTVTFDHSVQNCVVDVQPGFGDPTGNAGASEQAAGFVQMDSGGDHDQVEANFRDVAQPGAPVIDTSFMITAFC